jgi:hypothetical protein
MRRDEDWYDTAGEEESEYEDFKLFEKYPQYIGKWVLIGLSGEVIQVRSEPFAFAKLVKCYVPQLLIGHPDWDNPLF